MLDDDELDSLIDARPSERERVKAEHELIHKAASHPVRRQLIKEIGAFGSGKMISLRVRGLMKRSSHIIPSS